MIWNDYQDAWDWGMQREGDAVALERSFRGLSIESHSRAFGGCEARIGMSGLH
ncbi:hypothetical protein RISK_000886 [Rhodopirellula islandica]|uniref:Uncharacterized protein n=1 Tax=Rhodopirellula islandica TaxID=595434 RepID=A0A0J1BKM3_RHOIS|nr:hypothetical protein RISK_000886 [Rhodopirellula islandica]